MQRRAAAANFAVAAAVAAEAADAIPSGNQHSSRASAKVQAAHKRQGSNGVTKAGLDHVRSGRITKAMSGGSSGAGSSGGTVRFASLMDALGEMEAREGGFSQPAHAHRVLAHGSGQNAQPALFDGGSNINRWHAPLGPTSPRVLTLGADLFHSSLSAGQAVVTWSPSLCHSIDDAGSSLHHQIPLFKSAG